MNKHSTIQYAYTILYVKDVEATIAFYERAFGFEKNFVTPEKDYGEIASGSTTLAFANFALGNSNLKGGFTASDPTQKPFGMELAFTSDQVEETIRRSIEAGATLLENAIEKPWGQKVGYVRDINGFLIEICTPMEG